MHVRAALLALTVTAAGCAVVDVQRVDSSEFFAARRGDILSTQQLSTFTRDVLFGYGLDHRRCIRPEVDCTAALLQAEPDVVPTGAVLAAVAELRIAGALLEERSRSAESRERAITHYLDAARYAYAYLFADGRAAYDESLGDRWVQVRHYYNYATERVGALVFERARRENRSHVPRAGDERRIGSWTLVTERMDADPPRDAIGLDEVAAATSLRVKGLRNTYRRDGIGAEFVAIWRMPRDDSHRSATREIAFRPVTVLLSFRGESLTDVLAAREAYLLILDSYRHRTARIREVEHVLAANYSAPYAFWLARSDFRWRAIQNFLGRRGGLERPVVLMMQPYDPSRFTVVLIHGLASSPEAWVNLANELLGEEHLRDVYQVWQVYYPTNIPVAISQLDVRRALEESFARADPERAHPATGNVLLVGHSMGGLIARLLVSTGGERIWLERYGAPPGSPRRAKLARLEPYLDFQPVAGVRRVVFMATPHAGTDYAGNLIGRAASAMVRLPASLVERIDETADAIAGELPEAAQLLRRHQNAIDLLDASNPYVQITQKLSIHPGIPYHSIIARHDRDDPLERSTDGVVPYASAFLPGAASTAVVESDHHVQETPMAVREVRRILHEHAGGALR